MLNYNNKILNNFSNMTKLIVGLTDCHLKFDKYYYFKTLAHNINKLGTFKNIFKHFFLNKK